MEERSKEEDGDNDNPRCSADDKEPERAQINQSHQTLPLPIPPDYVGLEHFKSSLRTLAHLQQVFNIGQAHSSNTDAKILRNVNTDKQYYSYITNPTEIDN